MSNWRNLFAQRIYEREKITTITAGVKNLMLDEDDSFLLQSLKEIGHIK